MVERLRLPSLAAISAFEAAARHGSFAAAARELGTSAASVSYHVRRLERTIDVTLFRRFPHRVELTRPGKSIASNTIDAFENLRATFVGAAELDDRHLAITALPTFGASWLTPRLGMLRDQWGDIRIELDLSPEPRDLGAGHFDVAIRNGSGQWPGLLSDLLFPSIFMPLCAPALAATARQSWPEPKVPLLGRPDWWALWFRALGSTPPQRFGIELAEEHLDAAAAIAGHGVAIGSPILFRHEIEAGRLVPAHDLVAADGRSFWLTHPAARRHNRKVKRFSQWLLREADDERLASRRYLDAAVVIRPGAPQ